MGPKNPTSNDRSLEMVTGSLDDTSATVLTPSVPTQSYRQADRDVGGLQQCRRPLTWNATFVGWGRLGVIRRLMFNNDDSRTPLLLLLLEQRCCDLVAYPATAASCCCGRNVGPPPPAINAPTRVGWSRTPSKTRAQRQELRALARPDTICARAHDDLAAPRGCAVLREKQQRRR